MSGTDKSGKMTQADAARIQSSQAKQGQAGTGTFASRAQSAGDKNAKAAAGQQGGQQGGQQTGQQTGQQARAGENTQGGDSGNQ